MKKYGRSCLVAQPCCAMTCLLLMLFVLPTCMTLMWFVIRVLSWITFNRSRFDSNGSKINHAARTPGAVRMWGWSTRPYIQYHGAGGCMDRQGWLAELCWKSYHQMICNKDASHGVCYIAFYSDLVQELQRSSSILPPALSNFPRAVHCASGVFYLWPLRRS